MAFHNTHLYQALNGVISSVAMELSINCLIRLVLYAFTFQDILPQLEAHLRQQSETPGVVQYISTTDVVQNIPITITMQHNSTFISKYTKMVYVSFKSMPNFVDLQ